MPKIRHIIFDSDGTLIDSFWEGFSRTLIAALQRGWPLDLEIFREFAALWGSPTTTIIERCWPKHATIEELHKIWRAVNSEVVNGAFPRIDRALSELDAMGISQHVFSGRGRASLIRDLSANDLRRYFTRVISANDVCVLKPDPEGINLIVAPYERIGLNRDQFAFVGDGYISDRECAKAAGIKFIAVTESVNVKRERFLDSGVPENDIIASVRDLPRWLSLYG